MSTVIHNGERRDTGMTTEDGDDDEIGEEWLSPENAHPRAAKLLKAEFFWDITDENSPFGNDTGWDTKEFFRQWRGEHPGESPLLFLNGLMRDWDAADRDWEVVDSAQVQQLLGSDEFSFFIRDEAVLSLAFAQLVLEGEIDADVKRRALWAIERQSLPVLLGEWEDHQGERARRLEAMKAVLERL